MKLITFWHMIICELSDDFEYNNAIGVMGLPKVKEYQQFLKDVNMEAYLNIDPDYETQWEIAKEIDKYDLSNNEEIKDLFFHYMKTVNADNKNTQFKNKDNSFFTSEVKQFYIEGVLEYPTIFDLFKFKENISKEELTKGLNNFYDQLNLKVSTDGNQYWDHVLNTKEIDKMLVLLSKINLEEGIWDKFNNIKFYNKYRQLKFDKLSPSKIENNKSLCEIQTEQLYSLKIKIDKFVIVDKYPHLTSTANELVYKFINQIFLECIPLNTYIQTDKKTCVDLLFITPYVDVLKIQEKKAGFLKNILIEMIPQIELEIKDNKDFNNRAKVFGEKLLLKANLEQMKIKSNTISKNKL